MPVTHHGLSKGRCLLNHISRLISVICISTYSRFKVRTFADSSVPSGHSNHRYFIDFRFVGSIIHLWITFGYFCISKYYGYSQPTSPGFTHLNFRFIMHAGVSKEAFQGVTPSFYFSDYQFS